MNDKEYDQIAADLEKRLNEKNTLASFSVLSTFGYIEFQRAFHKNIPLDTFIVALRINVEDRCLLGYIAIPQKELSANIIEYILEQAALNIGKMILSINASNVPTIKETIKTALFNISGPLETS